MPIMQITDKEVTLKEDRIILTLADTTYEEQTKLIGVSEGITLETVQSKNNLEAGMLLDIKSKQDTLYPKFESYINIIKRKSLAWEFGEIPIFSSYNYNFDALGTNIQAEQLADNSLKNNIMQNEMYFAERRSKIATALWWLKTKWEERIKMALGELKITADTVNALHGNQKILATKETVSVYDNQGAGYNLMSTGDYKKVRTPGITVSGYDREGNANIIIEPEAQYEITASIDMDVPEPPTPGSTSPVSNGSVIITEYPWTRIKARFPNGIVAEVLYERGTEASGIHANDITITQTGRRLNNVSGVTLYYTLDGTKPTRASATVADGAYIDTGTGLSDIKVVRISKAVSVSDNLTYDSDMKLIMPWVYNHGIKPIVAFYNLLDKNNKYLAAIGGVPTSLDFTLDGKMLIMNGNSYYDTADWGVSPIYKPYDKLTLDDLIRVYK